MVTTPGSLMIVFETVAVVLATSITALSYRAYRRTGSAMYRDSLVGFVLLTAGVVFEAFAFRLVDWGFAWIHTIESFLFALGFGALYLSLRRP
jgi:hypothetical protein